MSLWSWVRISPALSSGEFGNAYAFIWPIAGLMVASVVFSLSSLFVTNIRLQYSFHAAAVLIPFLWIRADFSVLSTAILSILLILFAIRRIKKEEAATLVFSAYKILRAGLPYYFTVAALVTAFGYRDGFSGISAFESLLPKSFFNIALDAVSNPIGSLAGFPSLDPDATVDETLKNFIVEKLKSRKASTTTISPKEIQQLIALERQELSGQFGLELSGKEKIADVFYSAVAGKIHELSGPYEKYLPVVAVVAFFLAFKAFSWPIALFSSIIASGSIQLMFKTGILIKHSKEITIERLCLKENET